MTQDQIKEVEELIEQGKATEATALRQYYLREKALQKLKQNPLT